MNFDNIELVVGFLKERLESNGIKTVHSLIHEENKNLVKNFEVATVTSCLSKKACIFTTHLVFKEDGKNKYKFVINGQIEEKIVGGLKIRSNGWFSGPLKYRNTHGCEAERSSTFSINHYESYDFRREKFSDQDSIEIGIRFFQDFLREYKSILTDQFTEEISLCFSLKCLEELQELEDASFIKSVIAKLPKGLFLKEPKILSETCQNRLYF